ncbi:MAG: alpha/beta fold hydrolase [Erysipelotrichaceae bacterium]|nr:alpha/beta fold hydrolase [Erysipelotrichaceae bacterium]
MKSFVIDTNYDIDVNNDRQNIRILSTDENNPVILFVHGGPGVCDRSMVIPNQSKYLVDDFTMVCWDQRMAGKNYRRKKAKEKMTLDQQVEDLNCVVNYLCERFKKEKIYIVGHSWGSVLSCLFLPKHPEHIKAYIGMGQFVNGPENEQLSYDFVMDYAKQHENKKAIKDLQKIGRPVGGLYKGGIDALMVQRNYMTKFGGGTYKGRDNIYDSLLKPFFKSGEYKVIPDLYRYYKGCFYCLEQLWEDIARLEFDKSVKKLDVPVYLFQGDHDKNTPTVLARKWFDDLEAPYKEYMPFHESAHSPINEECELWGTTLKEKLLEREKMPDPVGIERTVIRRIVRK